jgi:hypothetical protein
MNIIFYSLFAASVEFNKKGQYPHSFTSGLMNIPIATTFANDRALSCPILAIMILGFLPVLQRYPLFLLKTFIVFYFLL